MSVVIRMHYDGKVFVPETPVDLPEDLPVNEPLDFELKERCDTPEWDPEKAIAAIKSIAEHGKPVGLPLEAISRESIHEDRGA